MKTQASFFNTISIEGQELIDAELKCNLQERRILELLYENGPMTPHQVLPRYCQRYGEILITSVRRAMTNLESKNLLIKHPKQIRERFGLANHVWGVNLNLIK